MAKVRVWNDNVHPHTEMFKGDLITIPAKECIEMDWEEAIEFRGQFTGIKLLGDDTPDPRGYKMIRVEAPKEPIFKEPPLVNHANGATALTREELEKSLAMFAHMRAAPDPQAETTSKPSYDDLVNRLAALEKMVGDRKKPGPKPKMFEKKAAG